jgi:4-amino-4-deoxy-L-arabinose transferase-like glycosyltransferase
LKDSVGQTISAFVNKAFWPLLIALACLFFLAVASSATWGLPIIWNIDERLHRVMPALSEGLNNLPEDITYPSLPLHTMVGTGKILSLFTADEVVILAGVRAVSALLGALVVILTALMTLIAIASRLTALAAAMLVMSSSGLATIAHYAHVDIYLTFFVTLSAFLLLNHVATKKGIWLYLGFFTIGLAASSKYNGISLLLGATLISFLGVDSSRPRDPWQQVAKLAGAYFLAFLGFFVGTPRAILKAGSYLEQLLPFLERQRVYAGPRAIGLVGQWGNTIDGLGLALFALFALATVWALVQAARFIIAKAQHGVAKENGRFILAILLILLAFELPIAFSRFYPIRYMVPAFPLLAVLAAWFLRDLWRYGQRSGSRAGQWAVALITLAIIFFSALRVVSVALQFENDGRLAAAEYLRGAIPPGTRTEHTSYPPQLPRENRVIDNYPLVVFKFEEDITAHTGANLGEAGIESRKPDYLVIDRKTFGRFEDEHVCELNLVECQFFAKLLKGETQYQLMNRFEYRVPPYLPDVRMDFVNVDVLVFERQQEPKGGLGEETWQNSVQAAFGEHIQLLGYSLNSQVENQLAVTLFWKATARMGENYKVFVHCLDADGQVITQDDSIPSAGTAPTEYWATDEIVADEHLLILPDGTNPGQCRLQVGLYLPQTGERLPASSGGLSVPDGVIVIKDFAD